MTIDKSMIASIASAQSATSKKAAFGHVLDLIENTDDTASGETVRALAALYRYFLPAVPAKPKTASDWTLKAIAGPKESRHYLQYQFSRGGLLMCCDGHRLHVAPSDRAPGYYDKAGTPQTVDAPYPDIEPHLKPKPGVQAVNIELKNKSVLVNGDTMHTTPTKRDPNAVCYLILGHYYNARYLLDALAMGEPGRATLSPTDGLLIDFDSGNRAMIMPVNG